MKSPEEFLKLFNDIEGASHSKDGFITSNCKLTLETEFIYWYLNKLEALQSEKIQLEDDVNFYN